MCLAGASGPLWAGLLAAWSVGAVAEEGSRREAVWLQGGANASFTWTDTPTDRDDEGGEAGGGGVSDNTLVIIFACTAAFFLGCLLTSCLCFAIYTRKVEALEAKMGEAAPPGALARQLSATLRSNDSAALAFASSPSGRSARSAQVKTWEDVEEPAPGGAHPLAGSPLYASPLTSGRVPLVAADPLFGAADPLRSQTHHRHSIRV